MVRNTLEMGFIWVLWRKVVNKDCFDSFIYLLFIFLLFIHTYFFVSFLAKDFVKNEYSSAAEFKFFLNHCGMNPLLFIDSNIPVSILYSEWPKGELEKEIANGRWDVVEVPPDVVLMNDPTKSSWDSINDSLKAACQ